MPVNVYQPMSNCTYIATALVRHSQSISATPLRPWVAIKKNGSVLCGHCTCMRMHGLGLLTHCTLTVHSRWVTLVTTKGIMYVLALLLVTAIITKQGCCQLVCFIIITITITLPLPLQFKNHTINYITIIIKTTLITITITLASVLHYITISTKSHVTEIFFIIIVIISRKT